jgi:hypothetical protein
MGLLDAASSALSYSGGNNTQNTGASLIDTILSKSWAMSCMYSVTDFKLNNNKDIDLDIGKTNNFDAYVTNVTINPITWQPIQEYIGGQWSYTNGRDELKQVDITLRLTNGLYFYTMILNTMRTLKDDYPDNQKWSITIQSMENTKNFSGSGIQLEGNKKTVLTTSTALLTNISSITFDANNKEVITFVVTFMYT